MDDETPDILRLTVRRPWLPKAKTVNATFVMDHFGIGFDVGEHVIAEDLEIPVQRGDIVCFTGESGSGKSSLLQAVAEHCEGVLNANDIADDDRLLIDALDRPPAETLQHFARFGLSEARLMLRTSCELSDGQRFRLRLAKCAASQPRWVLMDEFTSSLDRTTAKVIAHNVRRYASATQVGFLLATTHEDILEDLRPNIHVTCRLDGRIDVVRASVSKKKHRSVSRTTYGSVAAPNATGRTSLGGITARTKSAWSA